MSPREFGQKVAYVKLSPTNRVASAKKPSVVKKPPVNPAAASTVPPQKMVIRAAPSVPNPIAPPPTATKAAGVTMAPRYTAGGTKGRKVMPKPYASRTIKAPQVKTPAAPPVPTTKPPTEFGTMMAAP